MRTIAKYKQQDWMVAGPQLDFSHFWGGIQCVYQAKD